MTPFTERILVVDDDSLSRKLLRRAAETQGYEVVDAATGAEALQALAGDQSFDAVLLDVVMPELDGYETLERIKADESISHLPVIMISGVDDLESVVRCIEMGATDYLPKPFDPAILRARLKSSLAGKRLRDLEIEYLEQVGHVIDAAGAVEANEFEASKLETVARRDDALGQLARTFQRMASEVKAREDRLREQVRELTIEIDEQRQERKVAEITNTEYFKELRGRAEELRKMVADPNDAGARESQE
ncbi:MAG TPA: response regulator [Actinomycetota bacterium]|nr:response regulator [Actinomycetota bacterium]